MSKFRDAWMHGKTNPSNVNEWAYASEYVMKQLKVESFLTWLPAEEKAQIQWGFGAVTAFGLSQEIKICVRSGDHYEETVLPIGPFKNDSDSFVTAIRQAGEKMLLLLYPKPPETIFEWMMHPDF